jgi:hypothetical protein
MYLFSNIYKKSIYKDFLKKVNFKNYQNLQTQKGVFLELSFLNTKLKKLQRSKLKHLISLEMLSMQKAFFKYTLDTSKRKRIFFSENSLVRLKNRQLNYFCYLFSKESVGLIKDLQKFSNNFENKKLQLESINTFNLFYKNTQYFYDLRDLHIEQKTKHLNYNSANFKKHLLAFYRFYL